MIKSITLVLITLLAAIRAGDQPVTNSTQAGQARLLIICPEVWQPELVAYAQARIGLVSATVESLEAISGRGLPGDAAEQIKRHLYEQFKAGAIDHLLLVGDADILPMRYMMLDRATEPAYHVAFYPSDLYYADLVKGQPVSGAKGSDPNSLRRLREMASDPGSFDDWNARRDGHHAGYFGEVHGEHGKDGPINADQIDYRPEIAVGRWPVSTLDELKTVIAKSLATERALLDGSFEGRGEAAFLVTGGWVDCRTQFASLADRLDESWTVHRRFYRDPGGPAESEPGPDGEQAAAMLNAGLALMVHAGHGHPHGWDQSLGVAQLPSLKQPAGLPVLISAGCSTNAFATLPPYEPYVDIDGNEHLGTNAGEVFTAPPPPPACLQPARLDVTGFGEQLLFCPTGGAVAYIGCNTGSQPCALTLVEGFVHAAAAPGPATIGSCWNAALNHYWTAENLAELKPNADWYPPSIFFQGMKFMLFGDPSLPIAK